MMKEVDMEDKESNVLNNDINVICKLLIIMKSKTIISRKLDINNDSSKQ